MLPNEQPISYRAIQFATTAAAAARPPGFVMSRLIRVCDAGDGGNWPVAHENFSAQFEWCFCRSIKSIGKEIHTYRSTKNVDLTTTIDSGRSETIGSDARLLKIAVDRHRR